MKPNVLVLCTGNSCRSQMAEAYLNYFGQSKLTTYSAGIEAHGLNLMAVKVMAMDGLDISRNLSKTPDMITHITFDYVITVCDHAEERCPYFPGQVIRIHHSFYDPAKAVGSEANKMEIFIQVRNEIKEWCEKFVHENFS